jgi:hypothetical protein
VPRLRVSSIVFNYWFGSILKLLVQNCQEFLGFSICGIIEERNDEKLSPSVL